MSERTLADLNRSTTPVVWYPLIGGAACPLIITPADDFGRMVLISRDLQFGQDKMNPENVADVYEGCKTDEYLTRLDTHDYTNVAAYNASTVYSAGDMCKSSNRYFTYINETSGSGHTPPTTDTSDEYWSFTAKTSKSFLRTYFDDPFIDILRNKEIYNYHYTEAENVPISRKCFLLSYANVATGTAPEGDVSYRDIITAAMSATTDHGATIKAYTPEQSGTGNGQNWWLRSPGSASTFSAVDTRGGLYSNNASNSIYLRPAFSVASATSVTPVEDVGADGKVWILPDTKPNKLLDVYIKLGSTVNRPKQAKLDVSTMNVFDTQYEVCNNYGDITPVWETVGANGMVDLTNETKTTDEWIIGLRMRAKSLGSGRIAEPALVVVFEEASK